MILLDTNYLIRALVKGSAESGAVGGRRAKDESLCGPLDDDGVDAVRAILDDPVLALAAVEAAESARLYNAVGRPRHLRVDAMIAAAAIVANAAPATGDGEDLRAFRRFGLRLWPERRAGRRPGAGAG